MSRTSIVTVLLVACLAPAAALALGTAFTYQGRLVDAGSPANGVYDLQVKLFNAASGPAQVGPTLTLDNVTVSAGLFTAQLDFGAGAFDATDRWLEIGVRPGASTGTFTTLSPRQALTPAPSALYSSKAGDTVTVAGLTCTPGQVLAWNAGWTCGNPSGGTVTSVATGAGLTGGPITSSGTVAIATGGVTSALIASGAVGSAQIDTSQVQARIASGCPSGATVKTINADGTAVCAVNTPNPGFTRTVIVAAPGAGSDRTSLAIGADGLGLLSYYDQTNGHLKVAHCDDAACTSATTATIDSSPSVGYEPSLTIGSDGLGLISYYDIANGDLKAAHCTNATCTSATTSTLDATNDVGRYSSITIGADGLGLISYSDTSFSDLKAAHCNDTSCTSASTATLDSTGSVGAFTSIAIGTDGLGLISYLDGSNVALKVVHCANVTCTAASSRSTLDPAGTAIGIDSTSIAIGGDGLGLVSYAKAYPPGCSGFSPSSFCSELRVAHCTDAACTSAQITVLAGPTPHVSAGFMETSVAVGADGLGLIAYHDTSGGLGACHCSNLACSGNAVCSAVVSTSSGFYLSLTIGRDGLGLISHAATSGLNVVHCSNPDCLPFVERRPAPLVGVTSVTAGSGLSGGTLTSTGTVAVDFAGTGSATTVSRSDHDHFGQTWSGAGSSALSLSSLGAGGSWLNLGGAANSGKPWNFISTASGNSEGAGKLLFRSQNDSAVVLTLVGGGGGAVGINKVGPATALDVNGTATVTGFALTTSPGSGRVLTSDASGNGSWQQPSGGTVTSLSAGNGIVVTPSPITTTGSIAVSYGGTGLSTSVARSDHDHFGQTWTGAGATALNLTSTATGSTWFDLSNTSTGGKQWNLISTGSTASEGAGKLLLRSNNDSRVVMTLQGTGEVGIGTTGPQSPLDIAIGTYRVQFRDEGGVTPGLNLGGSGGNAGILRLRRKIEIFPNDAATSAGALDIRNLAGNPTITFDGATGNASFSGTVSKGGGSFKIDHPLDPMNKYLYHSFVESPDMMNIYDGNVTTDEHGYAVVDLPDWFEALNRDFRYQLTVIGDGDWARARVYRKIDCGRFTIQTDRPKVEVSWLVTGIRQDAFAEAHRIPVEQDKPAAERGTLLYPEAYRKP